MSDYTDLVARLREMHDIDLDCQHDEACRDAADAIEALQARAEQAEVERDVLRDAILPNWREMEWAQRPEALAALVAAYRSDSEDVDAAAELNAPNAVAGKLRRRAEQAEAALAAEREAHERTKAENRRLLARCEADSISASSANAHSNKLRAALDLAEALLAASRVLLVGYRDGTFPEWPEGLLEAITVHVSDVDAYLREREGGAATEKMEVR